jgi:hypothetical protein
MAMKSAAGAAIGMRGVARQDVEKTERKPGERRAKLLAIAAVPAQNLIKSGQFRQGRGGACHLQQIQPRRRYRTDTAAETNQRDQRGGYPDLSICAGKRFQGGQGNNHIADRAGANQQTLHFTISTGRLTSSVFGCRHI